MSTEGIKLQLLREIIDLPESDLPTVQEFLRELRADNHSNGNGANVHSPSGTNGSAPAEMSDAENPMLKFIGLASYDPPTRSIDDELYGDDPL